MQFEDPTDTLQSLRDLIDLQRAMDCVWLQSAAEQVCCHLQHCPTCMLVTAQLVTSLALRYLDTFALITFRHPFCCSCDCLRGCSMSLSQRAHMKCASMQIILVAQSVPNLFRHISIVGDGELTNARGCVQVAAVWQTADPAASEGTSVRMTSGTSKALADAQKHLHISQQQASTLMHMAAGFHW